MKLQISVIFTCNSNNSRLSSVTSIFSLTMLLKTSNEFLFSKIDKIFDKYKYDVETLRKEVDKFYKNLPGNRFDGIDENGKGLEFFTPRFTSSSDMYEKINNNTYVVFTRSKYYYVHSAGSASFS